MGAGTQVHHYVLTRGDLDVKTPGRVSLRDCKAEMGGVKLGGQGNVPVSRKTWTQRGQDGTPPMYSRYIGITF